MTETTIACRWAGPESPRLLRSHLRDCESAGCGGCQPCGERHCRRCSRAHVTHDGRGNDQTCAGCLAEVRDALAGCWITPELLAEALASGATSEAAMLVGPAGDPATWQRRHRLIVNAALLADGERHPAYRALLAWMEDCRDERHPMWTLGTWEDVVRDHLDQPAADHQPACENPRCVGCNVFSGTEARAYLGGHLTRLAHDPEFPFEDMARELAACRAYLEDAARNSTRPETGAPCIACGRAALVKDYGEKADDPIRWTCPKCDQWWDDETYRSRVAAVYVTKADRLTASQIAATYRVPEGTVRRWASGWTDRHGVKREPTVRRHGRDQQGRQLYDVEDVLATRDGEVRVS